MSFDLVASGLVGVLGIFLNLVSYGIHRTRGSSSEVRAYAWVGFVLIGGGLLGVLKSLEVLT